MAQAATAVRPAVTTDAVRKWCRRDGLPHRKLDGGGRGLLVRRSDLAKWIALKKPSKVMADAGPERGESRTDSREEMQRQQSLGTAAALHAARASLEESKAEQARLKLARTMGLLMDAEDVRGAWADAVGTFARGLDKIPDTALSPICRMVAATLERLGIKPFDAAEAVEALKPRMREELVRAVDQTRARLAEDPMGERGGKSRGTRDVEEESEDDDGDGDGGDDEG